MEIKLKYIICVIILISASLKIHCQTFEDYKKKHNNEVNNYQNQTAENISKIRDNVNKYIKEKDKEYSDYLKSSWEKLDLSSGEKPMSKPTPINIPVFDPSAGTTEGQLISTENQPVLPINSVVTRPNLPQISKEENIQFDKLSSSVSFYNNIVKFDYDKNLNYDMQGEINEEAIASYWDKLSATNYNYLLNQLFFYKNQLNLNDWGYFLLIKSISSEISKNQQIPLTWFLLVRSGYKVKIGYLNNIFYLLIASDNVLYGMPFYTFDNINYYILNSDVNKVYTYKNDFPNCSKIFNLSFNLPLNFEKNNQTKHFDYKYNNDEYNFEIKYNQNVIDFYKDFPLTDISVSLNSNISVETKESIRQYFLPAIKNKTELEAVNFLLNFVQKAFKYKTDDDQFGKEKFDFPEELFYYPFSDCNDRVSLFSYLVRDLLKLDVIGLEFPDHIASAVKINEEIKGDYIIYNSQKYYISDPTYINAPVGHTMPQYKNLKPTVVELQNPYKLEEDKKVIFSKLFPSENSKPSELKNISVDKSGNKYVVSFTTSKNVDGIEIGKDNSSKFPIYLFKFDIADKLIWAKQIKGGIDVENISVAIDKNGNCIISSGFNNSVSIGDKEIANLKGKDFFIAKFDEDGKIFWLTRNKTEDLKEFTKGTILVSMFNKDGENKWSQVYENSNNFNQFGLDVDNECNYYLKEQYNQ